MKTKIIIATVFLILFAWSIYPTADNPRTDEEMQYAQELLKEQRELNIEIPKLEEQERKIVEEKDSKRLKRRCIRDWIQSYQNSEKVELWACEWNLNSFTNKAKFIETANAESHLDEIVEAVEKINESEKSRSEVLMERVCKQKSPMCNDWDMFNSAKDIFEARWVPFWIALWIMNAESTLWRNYAWWCDASYNNWWGIKWKKNDDGSTTKDQPIPDSKWCWVYKFESLDEYFKSKANTLWLWYKACFSKNAPVRCISYAYVWNRYVAEQSWINNVMSIAK